MCGRFALHATPGAIALQFGLAHPPQIVARFNISPGTPILSVHAGPGGTRVGQMLQWGLIPAWAKDASIGSRLANARAETIAEKPSFRSAFRRRRCIVPASGFYEWQATAGRKQPWYIQPQGNALFGFAALYEHWQGPAGQVDSCALITTEPNPLMARIHDRMPVILPVEWYAHWLDPLNPDPASLIAMLRPFPADHMQSHAVSTRVNSVRNEGPALLEPLEPDLLG